MFVRKDNVVSAVISADKIVDFSVDRLIKYFLLLHKLKIVVSWWIRFADSIRLLRVLSPWKSETRASKFHDTGVDELKEAEIRLIRYCIISLWVCLTL